MSKTACTLTHMTTTIRTNATSVAELLRATRGAAGYSARDLAVLVGVSHGTISNWENGRAEPTVSHFIAWANATGQPADELLRIVAELRGTPLRDAG